jgi:putative CocE/NonD family hydrolase
MRIEFPLAVLLALIVAPTGRTQVPVPAAARSDPAALEAAIPGLACQAVPSAAPTTADGQELQFRLLFSCGRYELALESLDRWTHQRVRPPGETVEPWLRLELHARAMVLAARENISSSEALRAVFGKKFATLDDRSALDSGWMLGLPPAVARANFERLLHQFTNREALTQAELLDLLYWHSAWQTESALAPQLDAAIAQDDSQRYSIDRGVLIRTRQGATITADVVRPRRLAGPQPTVLRFTIYSDRVFNLYSAKDAAAHGYVGMLATARGKYLSTDKIVPWETEGQDTWAVIDWISRQPWSDGQVGMYGNSYDAFVQWAAAKNPHPALKTIVPSGATFAGYGMPMQHNVFQTSQYAWPLRWTNDRFDGDPALRDGRRWSTLLEKWFESGRPLREMDAIDGTPNEVWQRQLNHPSFDAYWQAMQPQGREFARIRIPVLSLTGYFDDAGAPAVNYLVDHYRYANDAEHYLVIGPWVHDQNLSAVKNPVVNGYPIDPVANVDTIALVYQWFDHVLRGGPLPALLKDRINYQLMGSNTWRHAPSIAKMSDRTLRLYLSPQAEGKRFTLSPDIPVTDRVVGQSVDFTDRKTRNNLYPVSAWLDAPDDATYLAYLSDPFDHAVCVCGLIKGELQATIDRKDFDFTWALYEATADGKYLNLSYYLGRASYARDPSRRQPLTPGRTAALPFTQTPLVGKQLAAGSRLLLLLTVNKNPYAQVNYGTGKDVSDESIADAGRPLKVQWHGASYIDVPLRDGAQPAPIK